MRTVVSVQTSLVCGSIERWGSEEQKQRWLPLLTSGEGFGCFGLTEPDTGSDAANLRTRAEKIDGGWRINGAKMWISLGNVSDVALIFAQTDPGLKHKGLACFLVPTDSDGFSTQEIHGKLGLRASDTAEISLDAVEVSDDALMGEVGDGFKVAMSALDSGRYSVAAGCVGIIEGCVQASVEYAKERKQFDVPIASFQLVQEMIADMIVRRDAARMLVRRAGLLKDAGKPSTIETSVAKLYATESAVEAANLAIQVHGGSGYVDDYPVERYLRDAQGDDPVRGHVADPEADHRQGRHRDQRVRSMSSFVEVTRDANVAICRLDRPEARNSLSPELMDELAGALELLDADDEVHCIVIAGSDEVFAAGADISVLAKREFHESMFHPAASFWRRVANVRTPLDRGGLGMGARRRLRARADLRHDRRLRFGGVRPARDHARDHPGRRRHPAPGARDRQAASDGAGAHRPALRCRGGGGAGNRQPGGGQGALARGGARARPHGCRASAAGGALGQAGRSRRGGDCDVGRTRVGAPAV